MMSASLDRWKQWARALKTEVYALYLAYRDPRVPWYARLFAACVVGYAFSPIDLIPDPIPVLGYLDDLVLVPLGVALALRLIPAEVMREIQRRTGLATISLGSGPHADVLFLFTSDICGESERLPRHARRYADLAALQRQIDAERVRALTEFRADVASGSFPAASEVANVDADELTAFTQTLDEG